MRDLVLTSEILTLPDMTGYLMIPGDYPIARVQYGYTPIKKKRGSVAVFKQAESASLTKADKTETPGEKVASLEDAL